ncbi:MAG: N-acetylmuramoyl-L-alanine amidase [Chthoniobacterales bacterium]|nr:N-acetylmuramoyl-L-alanine amidase [Chthoniobacterales bacterium]
MATISAEQLTPLAQKPNWCSLQRYANTITAAKFEQDLQEVYVPDGSWKNWITITPEEAVIQPYPDAPPEQALHLSLASSEADCKTVPRYWKRKSECEPLPGKPLAGIKIVLDPGHLGGEWAKMEERWFRIGTSKSVEEGTMTFITARHLAKRLRALGADVKITRCGLGPTTSLRPAQLRAAAIQELKKEKVVCTPHRVKKMEEALFYRVAEIHHRADWINKVAKPDLVICLHYDAEEWGNPKQPKLFNEQRLHFLISGDFSEGELINEDVRYTMLIKLLGRTHHQVVEMSDDLAKAFAADTGLPPFTYHNPAKARLASDNPYLWNRNLLATRLIKAPVVYCEAYVMNDREVFERVQLGDYKGRCQVGNKCLPSIYREYADAVAKGITEYYGNKL